MKQGSWLTCNLVIINAFRLNEIIGLGMLSLEDGLSLSDHRNTSTPRKCCASYLKLPKRARLNPLGNLSGGHSSHNGVGLGVGYYHGTCRDHGALA